jgi:hypothetical protein
VLEKEIMKIRRIEGMGSNLMMAQTIAQTSRVPTERQTQEVQEKMEK